MHGQGKFLTVQANSTQVLENRIKTIMHSSRMRTGRSLNVSRERGVCPVGCLLGGVCPGMCVYLWGGALPEGGVCLGGRCVSCDLSHHAFDVTCMLFLHQLWLITSAADYIVFGHVTCDACWDTPPDRMIDMCKNITFPQTSFAGGNTILWWILF